MPATTHKGLPSYALFSGMLAFVGLPIYIHAPKFFVDEYGISLTAIGTALLLVRLLDFVQDPALGWFSDRLKQAKPLVVAVSGLILAAALYGLFGITAPFNPLIWFILCVAVLFTAFSLLTIMFYAQGIQKAGKIGEMGHVRLAAWRETGALIGVCVACIAPLILQAMFPKLGHPLALFSIFFAVLTVLAILAMQSEWSASVKQPKETRVPILQDKILRRLLLIAFLNAAPVAVTSSLFLFFVEYRLGAADAAGPLLLAFFLSAAASVPLWGMAARRFGAKTVLLTGMLLSVVAFGFALNLQTGQIAAFAAVCIASGAALGADMTLLPALFARRVTAISDAGGQAFGLWSFCSKATLAIAAVTMLPSLEASGFKVGQPNSQDALQMLSILYALVPCILKILAFICLFFTKLEEI
ncbi:sugar:cation symporter [Amylibacter sp. SFDW26]|uniref:MFS transporter n=1 Tax=Amylibacter sp. SFDW26 TaxID=2652722 RepID=UPI00126240F1|nr:MFS transporter [Amylibacter sp. SFDW26]KAB7616029.1 sugar:cation symporter [Amylibacter sp. SFDW26]